MNELFATRPRSQHANALLMLAWCVYAITFAYAVWQSVHAPIQNWDMLGYVGSVISAEENDPAVLHRRVVEEVSPGMSPALRQDFFAKNPLSADAGNFYRQLPFYKIKPLYVAAVKGLHYLGAGLAQSTWLVSAGAFALLGMVLAWWRPQRTGREFWLLTVAALCLIGYFPMATLAAYSTPDALSLLFLMLALIGWLQRGSLTLYAVGACLAVLTRPDALIQVLTLTFYFALFAAKEKRFRYVQALAVAALSIGAYLAIQQLFGSAGWKVLFYRGFINDNFDFTRHTAQLSWSQYVTAVLWGAEHLVRNSRLMVFLAVSALALVMYFRRPEGQRHWMWFLLMAWATFAVRFLLFPNWGDERYYFYYYLLVIMASLELIAPRIPVPRVGKELVIALLLAAFTLPPVISAFLTDVRSPPGTHSVTSNPQAVASYNQGVDAYTREDYTAAIRLWREAGRHGFAPALYSLGNLYANGTGVHTNQATALSYYRRAAALGSGEAQFALGHCYEHGVGVMASDSGSYFWYSLAAQSGNRMAKEGRERVEDRLSPEQQAQAQRRLESWHQQQRSR